MLGEYMATIFENAAGDFDEGWAEMSKARQGTFRVVADELLSAVAGDFDDIPEDSRGAWRGLLGKSENIKAA